MADKNMVDAAIVALDEAERVAAAARNILYQATKDNEEADQHRVAMTVALNNAITARRKALTGGVA